MLGLRALRTKFTVPFFRPNNASITTTCLVHHQEEGVSKVEFVGPNGKVLPADSTVGDAAWHGGFDMTLDGKHVRSRLCHVEQRWFLERERKFASRVNCPQRFRIWILYLILPP